MTFTLRASYDLKIEISPVLSHIEVTFLWPMTPKLNSDIKNSNFLLKIASTSVTVTIPTSLLHHPRPQYLISFSFFLFPRPLFWSPIFRYTSRRAFVCARINWIIFIILPRIRARNVQMFLFSPLLTDLAISFVFFAYASSFFRFLLIVKSNWSRRFVAVHFRSPRLAIFTVCRAGQP